MLFSIARKFASFARRFRSIMLLTWKFSRKLELNRYRDNFFPLKCRGFVLHKERSVSKRRRGKENYQKEKGKIKEKREGMPGSLEENQ